MVKTLHFHLTWLEFDPWSKNQDPSCTQRSQTMGGKNTVSKEHSPLQCGWTSPNPQRAQIQKKKKKKEEQGEVVG